MDMSDEDISDDCTRCTNCKRYIKRIKELENKINGTTNLTDDEDQKVILDLSESRIEDLIDKYYDDDLFNQGKNGIISFIYSYIVRDDNDRSKILYRCDDQHKKIFSFYNDEGLIKDTRCKILIDSIYEPLIKKVNKIYRIMINKIYDEERTQNVEDSDTEDDEFDSDIEEVIASELNFQDTNKSSSSIDDRVNMTVNKFLEIKKCCNKNRKPIIDELSQLLYI